jgi:anti-sigma B factor antagonist
MIKKHFDTVVHHQLGTVTVDLSGQLTALAKADLEAAYTAAESQNPEIIWLNFTEVTYINSNGIALIISLLIRARQASRTLMAFGLRPFYAELFELAGLTKYLPSFIPEVGIG